MPLYEKICPVCGNPFRTKRDTQKYCSVSCRRYYCRRHPGDHAADPRYPVLREFDCKRCGTHVVVRLVTDRRTAFCCPHCERLYWKHRKSEKRTAETAANERR